MFDASTTEAYAKNIFMGLCCQDQPATAGAGGLRLVGCTIWASFIVGMCQDSLEASMPLDFSGIVSTLNPGC